MVSNGCGLYVTLARKTDLIGRVIRLLVIVRKPCAPSARLMLLCEAALPAFAAVAAATAE